MNTVVYILGAGFSAPHGLPVSSNFLTKAKDLYARDTEKYSHFAEVFDQLKKMADVKNYYRADLFNIEEVLSILEMRDRLEKEIGDNDKALIRFKRFICDVITAYTPTIEIDAANIPNTNFDDKIFGTGVHRRDLGHFVAGLFNLAVHQTNREMNIEARNRFRLARGEAETRYAVVNLNYDMLLETTREKIADAYQGDFPGFATAISNWDSGAPLLAKLHGSIENREIIPPTWSKNIQAQVHAAWHQAYQALSAANYIRILGYSLPATDTYVQYLLIFGRKIKFQCILLSRIF